MQYYILSEDIYHLQPYLSHATWRPKAMASHRDSKYSILGTVDWEVDWGVAPPLYLTRVVLLLVVCHTKACMGTVNCPKYRGTVDRGTVDCPKSLTGVCQTGGIMACGLWHSAWA